MKFEVKIGGCYFKINNNKKLSKDSMEKIMKLINELNEEQGTK